MQITFILSLVFAIVVALFAILNANVVTINLLFKQFELSQAVVILVSSVAGALIVFLLDSVKKVKGSLKAKELKKQITTLEKEKEGLVLQLEAERQKNEMLQGQVAALEEPQVKEEPVVDTQEEGDAADRV